MDYSSEWWLLKVTMICCNISINNTCEIWIDLETNLETYDRIGSRSVQGSKKMRNLFQHVGSRLQVEPIRNLNLESLTSRYANHTSDKIHTGVIVAAF